jgi:hypothetical protein
MKLATGWSTTLTSEEATREAYRRLQGELSGEPDLLVVYSTVTHDTARIIATLAEVAPGVRIHGGTSCLGVMTGEGFHSTDGVGLGLLGIQDPAGNYGVGVATVGDDPRAAGALAIQRAIEAAERVGEPPDLVWISGIPGSEEAVLQGIQDVIGSNVPIAGGSTADNTVEGHWQQFTHEQIYQDSIIVTAMYPSVAVHFAFHSGYSPTDVRGTVTRAERRTLYEIDGRPAADVYNDWTGGVLADQLGGGNVLATTTLHPLGRVVGYVGEQPYHRLAHPDSVTDHGALTLFADIAEGEEITLMAGTRTSLITRAGRVAQAALDTGNVTTEEISGALVIYCAGCMLTVQDQMEVVAAGLRDTLNDKPFLGTFTFGEQGCFTGGENYHGNLMISVVVFGK